MLTLKHYLELETKGWKTIEIAYLLTLTLLILIPSILTRDSFWAILSGCCGVISVVLTGKGKLGCYIFGGIQCLIYSIISFKATYYGETILNVCFLIPMEFVGFAAWLRNMNTETSEVVKRTMNWRQRLWTLFALVSFTLGLGLILRLFGDAMPMVDSFTTICTMIAFVLTVYRYSENWWIWVVINIFSVYMWVVDYMQGTGSMATLLMWLAYLVNSVVMLIRWHKEASKK